MHAYFILMKYIFPNDEIYLLLIIIMVNTYKGSP